MKPKEPSKQSTHTAISVQTAGPRGVDPSPKSPDIPDHVLERCIGSGAYGAVWLARNIMGMYRAVKVVYRENFPDDAPYEREFRGIRAFDPVSRTHDALIDILQVGRNDDQGFFYYIMELADDAASGRAIQPETYHPRSLAWDIETRGRLPAEECLELVLSLAEGLNHLHQRGLVHRDIKPSNIVFINGIPKIADIGLVTPLRDDVSLVGTEGYFLPGESGTVQGDIYALGKVLYEVTTGNPAHAYPALPQEFQPNTANLIYSELNAIVLKACELEPQGRYRDVATLRSELHLLRAGRSVKRLHVLESQLAKAKRALRFLIALSLLGLAVYYNVAREVQRRAERRQRQVGQFVAYGIRHMDESDFMGALPWYAAALELDQGHLEAEQTHRVRLLSTLRECPRPARMWFESPETTAGELQAAGQSWVAGDVQGYLSWVGYGPGEDTVRNLRLTAPTDLTKGLEVEDIAISLDGQTLVAGGGTQATVWVRDQVLPTHELAHAWTVYGVELSPDGRTLATCSGNPVYGEVWLWDLATGESNRLTTARGAFRCAGFSPDGKRLVVAGEGASAQVWDLETGQPEGEPLLHQSGAWVYHAEFSPNGTKIATAASDGLAKIHDLETGSVQELRHPAMVWMAKFSPDGRYLVTAGWDYSARVWKVADGELAYRPLKQSGKHLRYAGFMPGGRQVLTVNGNGVVCLWDLTRSRQAMRETRAWFAPLTRTGVAVEGNAVQLYSGLTNPIPYESITLSFTVDTALFNEAGNHLLLASEHVVGEWANHVRQARLWNVSRRSFDGETFTLIHQEEDSKKEQLGILRNIVVADHGNLIAMSAQANSNAWKVSVWDAATGRPAHPPQTVTDPVHRLCFSPDSRWLAILAGRRAILMDLRPGGANRVFEHPDRVEHVAFSPDHARIVTCRSDSTLFERAAHVWDLASGKECLPPLPHGDGVKSAEFSSDGTHIVTASEDTLARVWDVSDGRMIAEVAHGSQVYVARFSHSDRWIVTGGQDHRVRVWDAETGAPVTPWFEHAKPWFEESVEVVDARFLNADSALWTWGGAGKSVVWSLEPTGYSVEDLSILAELLSGRQVVKTHAVLLRRPSELWEQWQKVNPMREAAGSSWADEVREWHQNEARLSLREANPFAVQFHKQWVEELDRSAE